MKKFLLAISLILALSSCMSSNKTEERQELNLAVIDCDFCQAKEIAEQISSQLPDLEISFLEKDSSEALSYIEKFNLKKLPAFIFNQEITKTNLAPMLSEISLEKENEYLLLLERVNLSPPISAVLEGFDLKDEDYYLFGDELAPIQITEFSDFECPYCQKFHRESLTKLKEEYAGKIAIRLVNFPLQSHEYALGAAIAFQCSGPKRAEESSDYLFNAEDLSLDSISKELEAKNPDFEECISKKITEELIFERQRAASSFGVQATPTFLINNSVLISGALPYENFKSIFDYLLLKNTNE